MIFDQRTYVCRPGTIKQHMELYEKHGWGPQTRCLGLPILYGLTETGDVNSYVHIWAYKDAADRAQKRANMWSDPEWLAYTKLSAEAGYLVSQNNTILTAAPFYTPPITVD
ncbi:MAG: NIPSNAP family protein [Hyphomicrobiales bacterium]